MRGGRISVPFAPPDPCGEERTENVMAMLNETITILCVDDEPNVLNALRRLFLDKNYNILTASSAQVGLATLEQQEVQIVISDYRMPNMNGVEFLREVYKRWPDTVRIVLSGYADATATAAAINDGHIYKFVPKPWNDDDLLVTVKIAIERYTLYKLNRELTEELMLKNDELMKVNAHLSDLIAERSQSLDFTARSLALHQSLLNALPIGVLGIDADNTIVMCNDSCGSYCKDGAVVIGSSVDTAVPEEVRQFIGTLASGRTIGRLERKGQKVRMIGTSIGNKGKIIAFIPEDDGA